MKSTQSILTAVLLALTGCEYGDVHGSAENSDLLLGLKEAPSEICSFRSGARDFTGYFVSDFPATNASYFTSSQAPFLTIRNERAMKTRKRLSNGKTLQLYQLTCFCWTMQFLR
jgi:hypothetical protein